MPATVIAEQDQDASSIEAEVARLRAAQRGGNHGTALAGARALLPTYPANRDLRLLEASALRHLGRIDEALTTLDQMAAEHPTFSRMHQERGLAHVARRDAPAATQALLAAVNLNPALPHAWRMLEGLWRMDGDHARAAAAAAHVETLRSLPPEVVRATGLFADGEAVMAEALVRRFLLAHGNHPEAMRLLARIGVAAGVLDDAEALYAGVLALAPEHHVARLEYVQTLIARHDFAGAETALGFLIERDPKSPPYRTEAATIAVGLGQHERAIALYRDLLADLDPALAADPSDAGARAAATDLSLWLGHALKTVGDLPGAISAYRASAALRPDFGDAWWSLANLKTYCFAESEAATMRTAEAARSTLPVDRAHLAFALAKACDDQSNHAQAWAYLARGNALKRESSRYRPEVLETNTRLQKQVCTPDFFAVRKSWGAPARDPIFIVGLPRSGSTLIEQILASHTAVEGTQELPDIQRIVLELNGREPDLDDPGYPAALVDLSRAEARQLGKRYLADTRAYRHAGRPRFIDKMPNNFRHIGLIHLILPGAKIIDARRDPMSCCFSNLRQLFAQGQEFSYSIEDIARYYRTYLDLMAHWDAALPGRVLRVQHEDMVSDLEASVRRILDFCQLEYEAACVEFHKTLRSVRTPSSEQVRQPIFRAGLENWKPYEAELADLRAALGDALTRYRE